MARKAPTASHVERVLDVAENAIICARSDIARWVTAGPAAETGGRIHIDHLLAEAQAKYAEALRIVRADYVRGEPQRYPIPPTPLHPGVA